MARTKKAVSGNHLTIHRNDDGTVDMKWDWDNLLNEVKDATNIINVTEAKVKKTRKKK